MEQHGARTSALARVDTTHCQEAWVRERQREKETSALVVRGPPCYDSFIPGPNTSPWLTPLSLCVLLERRGDEIESMQE